MMDNLSRAQNKENEIKIENLKNRFDFFEKHTVDNKKEVTEKIEKFNELLNSHVINENPHGVTSQQVTIIKDPSPYQDASYSGDNYPMGISTFSLLQGSVGFPSQYGECLNIKTTKYRFAQLFFHAGNREDSRIYLRHWYPSTGWTEFITVPSSSDVDDALKSAKAYTDAHANDKTNPHSVTKGQIGLGNVVNKEQATKTEFDTHAADLIKHITAEEREKWNTSQLFKITNDDGQQLFYVNQNDDFHELLLKHKGFVHFTSHPNAGNSPGVAVRGIWTCNSNGTHGQVIAFDNANKTYRKTLSNGNWSDWEVLETSGGAQAKVDTHANNKTVHVTAAERTKWNNVQLYKLTQDNGERILIPDGTNLLTLPSGLYYGVSSKIINSPDPNAVEWFHYDVSTNSARKTIVVTATANPKRWFGTIHTDGSFKGWHRFITDADVAVTWQSPTLLNGWKQYATHKVQFSKNVLGEVEIIGSITGGTIGFEVPAFTLPAGYRPLQMTHFIGVASSIGTGSAPQFHRTHISTDGNVYIQSCSNTVNPNEFITFGFKFKSA